MASAIEFGGAPAVLGTAFVITERKVAEERVQHMAYHDTLTGLANRALLKDRLGQGLAQASRRGDAVGVLYLDLDRFKQVNDAAGHGAGDALLLVVARQIAQAVRTCDTVARIGGDEFVVVLSGISGAGEAAEIAERILASVRRSWGVGGYEFYITASMGVSMYPANGSHPDDLLRNADAAMYLAKERGRNRYEFFTSAIAERLVKGVTLERDLRHALDNGEFVLHYQPQVAIKSGEIVGVEALIRWRTADGRILPPASFLPVAEETGLILPIGDWVLKTACAQSKAWQDEGLQPLRMAVNISTRQFLQPDLPDVVASVLEDSGLSPDSLELEITETTAMQDEDLARATLKKLRRLGVHVSLDDFGTGYSSLSYLKRLPVDCVKIDGSFLRGIKHNNDDAAILVATIEMARNLGLRVVAEGVETEQQLEFLSERRCYAAQGFLFSEPVPAARMGEMLKYPKILVALGHR